MTFTSSVSAHCSPEITPVEDDGKSAAVLTRMSAPPNCCHGAAERIADRIAIANVHRSGNRGFPSGNLFCLFGHSLGAGRITIGNHDMRSARGGKQRHLAADAAAAAYHQHDLPAQLLLRRLAANLCVFQQPVLDAERFRWRHRDVVAEDLKRLLEVLRAALRKAPACLLPSSAPAPLIT